MSSLSQFVDTLVVPTQLVASMLAMGLTLEVRDFAKVLTDRRSLLIGMLLSFLLAPVLAISMSIALDLSPGWAVGLLLIAATPSSAIASVFTLLARGNSALAVSLTLATTALCVVTMPIVLHVFATHHAPVGLFAEVAEFALEVVPYLIGPLILGMVLRQVAPVFSARSRKWFVRLALGCLIFVIASALATGRIEIFAYGCKPPLAIFMFAAMLAVLGAMTIPVMPFDDAMASALSACVRNIGLTLLVVPVFFTGDERQAQVLYSCLFYGGIQFLIALPIMGSRALQRYIARRRVRIP